MFCKYCGTRNEEGSKFCEACGAKIIIPRQKQSARKPEALKQDRPTGTSKGFRENEPGKNIELPRQRRAINNGQRRADYPVARTRGEKNNKRKKLLLIGAGVLMLAAILLMGWIFMGFQNTRAFNDAMDEGNRYLLAENLEQAESHFLRAIEINPREVEPYLQLANIYREWGEFERAIDILEKGREAVSEECRPELEEVLDEILESEGVRPPADEEDEGDGPGEPRFRWVLEPSVEADDINFIKYRGHQATNTNMKHFSSSHAVIRRGNTYGLVDSQGNIEGGIYFARKVEHRLGTYVLHLIEPRELDCGMVYYSYILVDGSLEPWFSHCGGVGGHAIFYYFNGLEFVITSCNSPPPPRDIIEVPGFPMPVFNATECFFSENVQLVFSEFEGIQWYDSQDGLYGIFYQGQIVTDFVYNSTGSWLDGAIAVEQDGRWGYVNERGEIIIAIEFDYSWMWSNWRMGEYIEVESAFAASEGFIPLVRDGVWEMRDINGKVVIPPGIFEAIRPVYQGRSWVKQDGLWGMIKMITDITDEEEVRTNDDYLVWRDVENIIFSRHGGGWGIMITMKENGRFSGNYTGGHIISHREDIDNEVSTSNFEGRFSIVEQIDDNTFSLEIVEFIVLTPTGTEEIVDRIHFTYVEPVGLRLGDIFLLFRLGSGVSNLPESFIGWFAIQGETLSFWGLHNVDLDMGFIGE